MSSLSGRTKSRRLAVAALLAGSVAISACTTENPLYRPEADRGDAGTSPGADLTRPPVGADLATAIDLAVAVNACNGPMDRDCGPMGSLACTAGALTADRDCPEHSTCTDGYCAAPPPSGLGAVVGRSCSFNNKPGDGLCASLSNEASCQPFLHPVNPGGAVKWTCDVAVGAGSRGTPCTQGTTCRSGFCGSNGTCFVGCDNDVDCFSATPPKFRCKGVSITVEGRTLATKSCTPS